VLAIGPGLSRSPGALDFARRLISETPCPSWSMPMRFIRLRAIEQQVQAREADTILTPHPGEMGELMQMSVADVQMTGSPWALALRPEVQRDLWF
jgi:NAD(P)H-hydrate epimerase